MFKKEADLQERSKSFLKNKESRSIKNAILRQFPAVNEDEIALIFPNKGQLEETRLANKTVLYGTDGKVLFFDKDGRGELFPTLHALWILPKLMKAFVIQSPVSKFILNGADLMIPGILYIEAIDNLVAGLKVCIKIDGNSLPFAIGVSLVSAGSLREQCSGKAVSVLHVYGDLLTQGVAPNGGFTSRMIYPVEALRAKVSEVGALQCTEMKESSADNPSGDAQAADSYGELDMEAVKAAVNEVVGGEAEPGNLLDMEQEADDIHAESALAEDGAEIRRVDELIMHAAVLVLKYVIKDKQLPILASTFWSQIQKCMHLLGEDTIDIKQSSYRKVSNFLLHCHGMNLLQMKENSGVLSVTAVTRVHDCFIGAKVDSPEEFKTAMAGEQAAKQAAAAKVSGKVAILELHKLSKPMREVFGNVHGQYGEYLTMAEMRDILVAFIKTNQLENADNHALVDIPPGNSLHSAVKAVGAAAPVVEPVLEKATVPPPPMVAVQEEGEEMEEKLDLGGYTMVAGVLVKNLNSSGSGTGAGMLKASPSEWKPVGLPTPPLPVKAQAPPPPPPPTVVTLTKQEFLKQIVAKTTLYYGIQRPGSDEVTIKSGKMPKVSIVVEMRMGNKTVSLIRGMEGFGFDINKDLLKEFQKKFACSVAHGPNPTNPKETEIVLQGNFAYELERYFIEKYGLSKSAIEITAGKGAKLKKPSK